MISKDKPDPLFSIIVSVYNKRDYLPRLMESISKQTFTRFELVLIDASSTDGSFEYLDNISDERVILINQPNLGVSVAKNYGVSVSKSKYIAFIDADDYWEHGYLEEIERLITEFSCHGVFISGYRRVLKEGYQNVQYDKTVERGVANRYFTRRLDGWGVHTSSVVIDREVFYKAGGFPFLLGSRNRCKSWLVDCSGNILSEIDLYCLESGSTVVDQNYLVIPASLEGVTDLLVAVPDMPGEDQFLHDTVAIFTDFVFSSKILSNWDGNVENQMTRIKDTPLVHPHLFSMCRAIGLEDIKVNKKDVKNYIRYLLVGFARRSSKLDKDILHKYISFHRIELYGINDRYQLNKVVYWARIIFRFNWMVNKMLDNPWLKRIKRINK